MRCLRFWAGRAAPSRAATWSSSGRHVAQAIVLVMLFQGCSAPVELEYSSSEKVAEFGEHQKQQLKDALAEAFGDPLHPRIEMPEGTELGQLVTDPERLAHGAAVFNRRCAGCHGVTGDGAGPAAPHLQPKPRDYRRGVFKFTSTPFGDRALRSDLERVIRRGAKGTSMPGFRFLPDQDIKDLVEYVVMLSYRGEVELLVAREIENEYEEEDDLEEDEVARALKRVHRFWVEAESAGVMPISAQPKYDDTSILAGRKAFLTHPCSQCHKPNAKGQTEWLSHEFIAAQEAKPPGEREKINYDDWGHPAPAADLTAGMLHGGRRPIDIYRRIYTGINGTPMPAFAGSLAKEPETIWHLTHYVLSVIEGREVPGIEDVKPDKPPVQEPN